MINLLSNADKKEPLIPMIPSYCKAFVDCYHKNKSAEYQVYSIEHQMYSMANGLGINYMTTIAVATSIFSTEEARSFILSPIRWLYNCGVNVRGKMFC